jgi:Kef-type K+ transport system membrane component KefB
MARSVAVSLLVVAAAAALAPVFSELLKRFRIPSVLFELGVGILVGPSVLGRADLDPSVFPTDGRWIDEVEDPASDGL